MNTNVIFIFENVKTKPLPRSYPFEGEYFKTRIYIYFSISTKTTCLVKKLQLYSSNCSLISHSIKTRTQFNKSFKINSFSKCSPLIFYFVTLFYLNITNNYLNNLLQQKEHYFYTFSFYLCIQAYYYHYLKPITRYT